MNPALLRRRRRRGGGAPAFSPLSLSPLVWLDAGALLLSEGAAVSTWTDTSGNAHHATQVTGAVRPTLTLVGINNLPSVLFTAASGQYFDLTGLSGLTEAEVFVVLKRTADPPVASVSGALWWLGTDPQPTFFPFTDGNIYDDAFLSVPGRINAGNPTASLAAAALVSVASKTGEWTVRVNGAVHYTTGVSVYSDPDAPVLGKGQGSQYMDGLMAQFLVFPAVLADADRTLLQNWAISKYGIV